jgi:hypothetical protein
VRLRRLGPLKDLWAPVRAELQRSHPTILPHGRSAATLRVRAAPGARLLLIRTSACRQTVFLSERPRVTRTGCRSALTYR